MRYVFFIGLLLLVSGADWPRSIAEEDESTTGITSLTAVDSPKYAPWGVDLSGLSPAVHPGDDFFGYANGGWVKTTRIEPSARTSSVHRLARKNTDDISADLVADIVKQAWPADSDEAKFVNLYYSYLDRRTVNRQGLSPIRRFSRYIDSVRSKDDLADALGQFRLDLGGLFYLNVRIDPVEGRRYIPSLEQATLLLGIRQVYLRDDPELVERREESIEHLANLLGRISSPIYTKKRVRAVIALEARLAASYPSRVELRDPDAHKTFVSLEELAKLEPRFNWEAYFSAAGIASADRIHIRLAGHLEALVTVFDSTPTKVWRDYLRLRLLTSYGEYLTDPVANKVQDFQIVRRGVEERSEDVEEKAGQLAMSLMPDVVGKAYLRTQLVEAQESEVSMMAEAIRGAYRRRIQASSWLSSATKTKAIEKLDAVEFAIGGPSGWNDYSGLAASRENLFSNVYWARQLKREGVLLRLERPEKAPDANLEELRSHVFFSPLQVGAYYVPSLNTVIIPAAYLQAPFYDPAADMAVNFGALGTTIGHELGHAFDDQGSKYGADGQLDNWWLPEDRARFERLGARLGAEFATYEAYRGIQVEPALTLGESLSDLAGLEVAYDAFRELTQLDGQSASAKKETQQRFILGYAQKRRSVRRPGVNLELALVGAHAPPTHRVNGILPHFDIWYEAFDISPHHSLWRAPKDRLTIW